ncbi:sphingomyelin phosphodiesterase [Anaeramoeba flamelloides]|uniref:Sphingomyelin phosphodiesterase n=1 Tax=Anaeramoeba flamelloides TaxID=1746091 RepID=A0AAV7ZLZ0_9EUKA|nr:sphingomyelin phosphodiesterase [Anaeramoeba flamelloides]
MDYQKKLISIILFTLFLSCIRARTGQFIYFSDAHLSLCYLPNASNDDECEINSGDAGVFGDYYCNNPFWLIENSAKKMKELLPNPDFIIHGGDTNEQFYHDHFTIIESIKFVNEIFDQYFPGVPIIYTPGNHDFFPTHNSPYYNTPFFTKLSYSLGVVSDAARATIQKGAYYSVNVNNMKIISLNTIMWYKLNDLTEDLDGDIADQLSWVESELESANDHNQGVLFIGHISPGCSSFSLNPSFTKDFQDQFLDHVNDWQEQYGSIILGYLYGHKHCDNFRCGTKDSLHILNPSLNPRKRINSAFRIYNYSDSEKILYDYSQYYNNLRDSNDNMYVTWEKSYNTKESPMNFQNLTCQNYRAWNNKLNDDQTLFDWFVSNYYPKYEPTISCSDSCKKKFLCAQIHLHRDDVEDCVY